MYYIQPSRFTSINSHAPTVMPHGREVPEVPSAQTKSIIFGIFLFLDAYIIDFCDLLLGQAIRQSPGRSAFEPRSNRLVQVRGTSSSGKKGPKPNQTKTSLLGM